MLKREIVGLSHLRRVGLEKIMGDWARQEDAEVWPMGRLVRRYRTEGKAMHWHISGPKKGMGTVEVTYLPSAGTVAVIVHDNRKGYWAGRAYLRLAQEVKKRAVETRRESVV